MWPFFADNVGTCIRIISHICVPGFIAVYALHVHRALDKTTEWIIYVKYEYVFLDFVIAGNGERYSFFRRIRFIFTLLYFFATRDKSLWPILLQMRKAWIIKFWIVIEFLGKVILILKLHSFSANMKTS